MYRAHCGYVAKGKNLVSDTGGEGDFGFMAGRTHRVPVQVSDNALGSVLEAVAILLDWRKRPTWQSGVVVRMGSESREYRVTVSPRDLNYEVVDVQTGRVQSFDSRSGLIREGSSERPLEPYQLSTEPMAVRLAFPVSLGIWGRPGDSYRMTGARRTEDRLVVALAHEADPSLTGELTIDVKRRIAIRLNTPTIGIEYTSIGMDVHRTVGDD